MTSLRNHRAAFPLSPGHPPAADLDAARRHPCAARAGRALHRRRRATCPTPTGISSASTTSREELGASVLSRHALALRDRPEPPARRPEPVSRARTPPACARSTPSTRRRSTRRRRAGRGRDRRAARCDLAPLPPEAASRARPPEGRARHRRAVGRAFDPLGAAALLRGPADRPEPGHGERRELRSGAGAGAAAHRARTPPAIPPCSTAASRAATSRASTAIRRRACTRCSSR